MRRRFFWSIFGVSTVLVVVLLGAALGAVNAVRERATRAELERAGRAIGTVLEPRLDRRAALEAILAGAPLRDVVGDLAPLRLVAGGSDIDLAAVGPDGVIGRGGLVAGVDLTRLRAGESQLVESTTDAGEPLFVYVTPIGRLPARDVVIVASVSRVAAVDVRAPGRVVILVLAIMALVAALLARVLSRRLTRQLQSVADAADRLSSGDMTARAEQGGSTEVAAVAEAFNSMAGDLEASRDRERQFLLAVGHDLRTPLTTITGYAEALEDGLDEPSEVRRIAGVMTVEGRRLRRLIEDVMLLARLDSSDFGLRPEPVDVAPHLDGVLAPFRDRAAQVRVSWEQELDVPGLRLVDPDRLAQIVVNLVENALRHTPETGRVRVSARADGRDVVVRVDDTGPGIDPADLPHVFERFYVAARYRGVRPEGSGLGLSIVDRLVRAMGSQVTVTSPPTGGTTFETRLPAPPT